MSKKPSTCRGNFLDAWSYREWRDIYNRWKFLLETDSWRKCISYISQTVAVALHLSNFWVGYHFSEALTVFSLSFPLILLRILSDIAGYGPSFKPVVHKTPATTSVWIVSFAFSYSLLTHWIPWTKKTICTNFYQQFLQKQRLKLMIWSKLGSLSHMC